MSSRKYSDKQKLAYYKRLAAGRPGVVRGRGAYKADKGKEYYRRYRELKSKSRAADPLAPPDSVGAKIGGWLGHGAQKIVKALTGFGDYSIEANSVLEGGMSPPQIVNSVNTGGVILRHREYIADIVASTTFTNQIFDINPGLGNTFPWLAQVANAFELYRLRGLVFEFKSMSSDAVLSTSASSALGTVIMATQYNSLNPGFTSAIQMENHEFANASKPSCDFYHPVECKKSLIPASELYIRDGAVPTGGDIRLFDIGQFNIATLGMQNATGVIGQLWCTYEVELYQHAYTAPNNILSAKMQASSCTNTQWLGATRVFVAGSSLDISVGASGNSIVFPANLSTGSFLFHAKYVPTGGSTAMVTPTITTVNCTLLSIWCAAAGFDNNVEGGNPSMTATSLVLSYWVVVTDPGAKFTFSGGTLASANCDIVLASVDGDIGS